ncbi:thioredoxin family protein [Labilibacter sediminis]|nr:thioredoxin family protein [Labilibacter sediminis]
MTETDSLLQFEQLISNHDFVLAYFSHDSCNVCHVLLPKIKELIQNDFPNIKLIHCNTERAAKVAAQNSIFTVPSILIFINGKESYRFSRNISLSEFSQTIARPYHLIFD